MTALADVIRAAGVDPVELVNAIESSRAADDYHGHLTTPEAVALAGLLSLIQPAQTVRARRAALVRRIVAESRA